jgi:hypothetical protein
MKFQTKFQINLTVRSFAYVAKQLAVSPAAQYEQILSEAEKHCQALRVVQRDVFEISDQKLRDRTMTETAFHRRRKAATLAIAQAQEKISRIAMQYVQHEMAA